MNRRRLLTTAFAGAAASMLRPELEAQAPAAGGWPIKPLPFDPKKLKGLSEKLIVSHHDNNYAGAARRIGQIQQMLAGLPNNAPGFQIKGLRMEELIATNSAILHEEYFGNLGGDGKASGTVQQAISADFGDTWRVVRRLEGDPGSPGAPVAEYSYPWIVQDRAGEIHVLYTWGRSRIKHAHFNTAWLEERR